MEFLYIGPRLLLFSLSSFRIKQQWNDNYKKKFDRETKMFNECKPLLGKLESKIFFSSFLLFRFSSFFCVRSYYYAVLLGTRSQIHETVSSRASCRMVSVSR